MKKLLALSVALILSTCVHAQTTGADSRLIATVNYSYVDTGFVTVDSTLFIYTGNNGWDYATEGWKYDSATTWQNFYWVQTWDVAKGIKQQLAGDRIMSTITREPFMGMAWYDHERVTYTYTNGQVGTELLETAFGSNPLSPEKKTMHNFDARGLETETVAQTWNYGTAQWENASRIIYYFNAAKQNDTTWLYIWANGQWIMQGRIVTSYVGGMQVERLQQNFDNAVFRNAYKTNYGYLNGKLVFETGEMWEDVSGIWIKTYKREYDHSSAGDRIDEQHALWTGSQYVNYNRVLYTYNEFHRMLTREEQTWDTASAQWTHKNSAHMVRNYYEAYTNDVTTVAANHTRLEVYPVPAKEQITISASFRRPQQIAIMIMDMNGRVVKQVADQAGTQYRKAIDVADLPAGNYMIKINGTTEVASKMITVGN